MNISKCRGTCSSWPHVPLLLYFPCCTVERMTERLPGLHWILNLGSDCKVLFWFYFVFEMSYLPFRQTHQGSYTFSLPELHTLFRQICRMSIIILYIRVLTQGSVFFIYLSNRQEMFRLHSGNVDSYPAVVYEQTSGIGLMVISHKRELIQNQARMCVKKKHKCASPAVLSLSCLSSQSFHWVLWRVTWHTNGWFFCVILVWLL